MTDAQEQRQSRDDGSDTPGGGPTDRPRGTVDEDANPPLSDPDDDTTHGGTGTLPPQDTGSAIPPYEGRQTSAQRTGESHKGGVNVGGAAGPVEDADYKAAAPSSTPGGATASPADEQPASEASEIDLDPDMTGPGHVAGSLNS
jgi:hypothetical protein